MTWHVDPSMLERYVRDDLSEASVMSAEAHLLTCAACRSTLTTGVDADQLDRMWAGVRDAIDAPKPRVVERVLIRVGVPDYTARLLATTPTLHRSWIISVVMSLSFAVAASHWFGSGNLPFLAVAPLVPVLGVAWSFGGRNDPLWEIGRGTPTGGFRLVLIRSSAVLSASMAVSAIVSVALPKAGWVAFAWLLPSFGLTVLTMALSTTRIATETAAVGVSTAWALAVAGAARFGSDSLAAFGARGQVTIAIVAVISVLVLVERRDAFERRMGARGRWA